MTSCHFQITVKYKVSVLEITSIARREESLISSRHSASTPHIGRPVRMVIFLNGMEMGLKGSKKELILLDKNFSATLINSMSSKVFIVVR